MCLKLHCFYICQELPTLRPDSSWGLMRELPGLWLGALIMRTENLAQGVFRPQQLSMHLQNRLHRYPQP